jgi:hypothetical protein
MHRHAFLMDLWMVAQVGAAVGNDGFGAIVLPKPISDAPVSLLRLPS